MGIRLDLFDPWFGARHGKCHDWHALYRNAYCGVRYVDACRRAVTIPPAMDDSSGLRGGPFVRAAENRTHGLGLGNALESGQSSGNGVRANLLYRDSPFLMNGFVKDIITNAISKRRFWESSRPLEKGRIWQSWRAAKGAGSLATPAVRRGWGKTYPRDGRTRVQQGRQSFESVSDVGRFAGPTFGAGTPRSAERTAWPKPCVSIFIGMANARKVVIGHCGPHLDFD